MRELFSLAGHRRVEPGAAVYKRGGNFMCCNFKGCASIVIGVVLSLAVAVLAAFGAYSGILSVFTAGIVVAALSFLVIMLSSYCAFSKSGCCQKDTRQLVRMRNCILIAVISAFASVILSTVLITVTISALAGAIIIFFAVLFALIAVYALIAILLCLTSERRLCEEEASENACDRMRNRFGARDAGTSCF